MADGDDRGRVRQGWPLKWLAVHFPLGREIWMALNVATIALLVLSMRRKG